MKSYLEEKSQTGKQEPVKEKAKPAKRKLRLPTVKMSQ